MKFIKKEKEETRYFVPEIAQAIGVSEGTIRGYFINKVEGREKKSTKDGLTLDDIVKILERTRTRGDGIDFGAVTEIRKRLVAEKRFLLDWSDEETDEAEQGRSE